MGWCARLSQARSIRIGSVLLERATIRFAVTSGNDDIEFEKLMAALQLKCVVAAMFFHGWINSAIKYPVAFIRGGISLKRRLDAGS